MDRFQKHEWLVQSVKNIWNGALQNKYVWSNYVVPKWGFGWESIEYEEQIFNRRIL